MSGSPRENLLEAYFEFRTALKRYLQARLHDRSLADDILQDLYIKINTSNNQAAIDNPKAFLFRAAGNLVLDHSRSGARRVQREQAWSDTNHNFVGAYAIDTAPTTETHIEHQQRLEILAKIIHQFPPQRKKVFTLHKLQGFSHQEVAEKLNISKKAVEKHMSKAHAYLAIHFKSEDEK